ncbi:MAG: class I SAM-dependent methyltransferase [Chromatiales bacterium]|nr:class I SAM-dependent methyltransferase [Chromatiales bacterium]
MTFLEQFEQQWAPRLGPRRDTFRATFSYLLRRKPGGHLILETGCARQTDNWEGDGQSTYMFDRFAEAQGGDVYTVDINPASCDYARSIVGQRTRVFNEDSVPFLHRVGRELRAAGRQIDLLYLDSFDWDAANPVPSALHHLKELCAIAPALTPGTLVVVDDSFHALRGFRSGPENYVLLDDQGIAGKAMFVAQYFQQIGVPLAFDGYQCGWVLT